MVWETDSMDGSSRLSRQRDEERMMRRISLLGIPPTVISSNRNS